MAGEDRGKIEAQWANEKEVSKISSFAIQSLRNFRHQGRGPSYSKIGRAVRYKVSDVIAFLESKKVLPRDEK
jgi:hypothetical protein